ncbi:MAG: hypothetical protein ACK5VG_02450 [Burkholderiales bacterium]|jgi:hypothetical protein
MNAISILKDEYPGDKAWTNYVSIFIEDKDIQNNENLSLNFIPDKELATILVVKMGAKAINWFHSPCPALEGRTPKDIFENEPMGCKVLRTLLMRMPT